MNKKARAIHYDAVVRATVPYLKEALKHSAKCAEHFTIFFNSAGAKAPNGKRWNESAVLKARRYLQQLGLDTGPLNFQAARDNCIGHDQRRAMLKQHLAEAGAAYTLEIASPKSMPLIFDLG